MAGLLNLVPRYLPRYGMAPEWAKAVRPLVLVFAAVAFLVTWVFDANVDAQSGAYATGVLVLMTSASVAVTLSARRRRKRGQAIGFGDRSRRSSSTPPSPTSSNARTGCKIASLFILAIVVVSLVSRVAPVLRAARPARSCWTTTPPASSPTTPAGTCSSSRTTRTRPANTPSASRRSQQRAENHIPSEDPVIFLEVTLSDASEFSSELDVHGTIRNGRRVLEMTSPVVSNSIAALLLHLRDTYGVKPNVYFEWTEGNPVTQPAAVPVPRRRRDRAHHPGGAAPGRTRPADHRPRVHVG